MPELPEVDIIKQSLKKSILNKKIIKVIINNRNLRFKINKNTERLLKNRKIIYVSRIAKYLIIYLDDGKIIIFHFGMSGTLHLIKKNKSTYYTNLSFYGNIKLANNHNHIVIIFKKFKIIYNDPRRFGFIKVIDNRKKLKKYFQKIGPEPLDKFFSFEYLKKKLEYKKKNIKNILLDQSLVSGLGNIYVNEILFYARVNQLKSGQSLRYDSIKNIIKYSKLVLKIAIKSGGSSIRDFKSTDGNKGNFQDEFKVYGKNNHECPRYKCNGKILKVTISNRSSFYCNSCQK